MLSRQQKREKKDIHWLTAEGMVACNPRDKEASHRAAVQGIATEIQEDVTCKKCWVKIREEKSKG